MALSNMEYAICNKMKEDFDPLTAPINKSKSEIKNKKNDLQSLLNNMVFSPDLSTITAEVDTLKAAAKDVYPTDALSDMQLLKDFIDNCLYLEDAKPVSTIIGTTLGVFDEIDTLVNAIAVPEFGAANLGSYIDKLMSGIDQPGGKNLTELFMKNDTLIDCLATICGPGDPQFLVLAAEYANTLNNLYNDLGVESNPVSPNYGKFDFDTIYNNAGMTVQQKLQVTTALAGVNDTKTEALTSIADSVDKAKTLLKTGFF